MAPTHRYLLVGGGMAADAAARGIRELDADGEIVLLSAELDPPYARPPLSKGLWKGEPLDGVWRGTPDLGVTMRLGRRAVRLDLAAGTVEDDHGERHRFDKLLLATGGSPRRLPFGGDDVIAFRTLDDYRRLREAARPGAELVVVGGGFIGSELAAALALQGCAVTMLFPEDGIGARVFPADLARHLVEVYRERGVDVRPGAEVVGVGREGGRVRVETRSGARLLADAVVAGIGIVPATELAEAAGIAVDDGILVDARLETSQPGVFAAGDVARFESPALGRRLRVEHEDNAVTMGRAAGRAMAGDTAPYTHLPLFYSDLFDDGYEAVGVLDPRGETVADWQEPYRKGVVYSLAGGRVQGVLLWNTWDRVEAARALIAEPGPFSRGDLIGRLSS